MFRFFTCQIGATSYRKKYGNSEKNPVLSLRYRAVYKLQAAVSNRGVGFVGEVGMFEIIVLLDVERTPI